MPALGTLDWRSAAERPDLLAPPVARLVVSLGVTCYTAPIDQTLADTAAFCTAYDVPLERSANCVVVSARRADQTRLAACLVLATDRADINKTVRRHLNARKISFAAMHDAVRETQMEFGGITPVGLPPAWPILIDTAVAGLDWVVVGSGIRASKLLISGASLTDLPYAEVLPLRISAAD